METKRREFEIISELRSVPTREIMTPKEVAEYLRVHVRTIYRLAKTGRMPSVKVGGSWRFKKETVDSWPSHTTYPAYHGKGAERFRKAVGSESQNVIKGVEESLRYRILFWGHKE